MPGECRRKAQPGMLRSWHLICSNDGGPPTSFIDPPSSQRRHYEDLLQKSCIFEEMLYEVREKSSPAKS